MGSVQGHHYGAPLEVTVEDGALVIRIGVEGEHRIKHGEKSPLETW